MIGSRRAWWGLGLAVTVIALGLEVVHRPERFGIDFHTYLAAAVVGLHQGWPQIYDQALVAAQQKLLVPGQLSQPFLSPPFDAWIVAPLTFVPYSVAYPVWAVFTFGALAGALSWSGVSSGISRWVGVVGALSPWWVVHAVAVGQVVTLVAAGVVVAWRLLRDDRQVAAGLFLALIFLKPNTAILVPFALLVAGRYRALGTWVAAGAVIAVVAFVTLGVHGATAYLDQLRAPLPGGADYLTLKGTLGATGAPALVLRVGIIGMVMATAYKLRATTGLVVPIAIVGSLAISPYLHGSDLCLLSAAAWMVWEERPVPVWRAALVAGWTVSSPFLVIAGHSPGLNRLPWLEYALLAGLLLVAWRPFTGTADLRRRAPA